MFKKIWQWFWRPTQRFAVGTVFIVGGLGGIIFWGGFNTAMEYTNTQAFCISCHEMRDTVYKEYQKSVHYKNPSGVRASCSDCHVPKAWTPKLVRKIQASSELYHKLLGTISTPEKFEAKRLVLAERVWASMKASDSRECRNCHSKESMDFKKQGRRAAEKMQAGFKEGKTCIECHKGLVHKLPIGYGDDDD
ncbi:Cytochrome c-type protein NapC [hydrothermal vent metagenome]|uniref:Cytochrome c-type protein NapC n=1 Tax=hydrothermal vent metagenome TaxID=652676 RepID=A0A3B0RL41_9ZZZZ